MGILRGGSIMFGFFNKTPYISPVTQPPVDDTDPSDLDTDAI